MILLICVATVLVVFTSVNGIIWWHIHSCMHRMEIAFATAQVHVTALIEDRKAISEELKQLKHIVQYLGGEKK